MRSSDLAVRGAGLAVPVARGGGGLRRPLPGPFRAGAREISGVETMQYRIHLSIHIPSSYAIIDINMSARRPHPGLASTHLSVLHRVTYTCHTESNTPMLPGYAGTPVSRLPPITHDHRVAVQQAPARTSPEIDYRPEDPNRGHHQPIQKTIPSVRHLHPRRPFKSQPPPPPLQYSSVRRRRRNRRNRRDHILA